MYLIYIEKNAEFEHSGREGGYKDYYNKREERRRSRNYDGAKEYFPMTDRGKADEHDDIKKDLAKNGYYEGRDYRIVDTQKTRYWSV